MSNSSDSPEREDLNEIKDKIMQKSEHESCVTPTFNTPCPSFIDFGYQMVNPYVYPQPTYYPRSYINHMQFGQTSSVAPVESESSSVLRRES